MGSFENQIQTFSLRYNFKDKWWMSYCIFLSIYPPFLFFSFGFFEPTNSELWLFIKHQIYSTNDSLAEDSGIRQWSVDDFQIPKNISRILNNSEVTGDVNLQANITAKYVLFV